MTFAATYFASRRLSRPKAIRRRRAGRLIGSGTQTVHRKRRRAAPPPAGTVRLWRPLKVELMLTFSAAANSSTKQRRARGDTSLTMMWSNDRGGGTSRGSGRPELAPTTRPHLAGRHGNSDGREGTQPPLAFRGTRFLQRTPARNVKPAQMLLTQSEFIFGLTAHCAREQ